MAIEEAGNYTPGLAYKSQTTVSHGHRGKSKSFYLVDERKEMGNLVCGGYGCGL
jgi:hypothetical protein